MPVSSTSPRRPAGPARRPARRLAPGALALPVVVVSVLGVSVAGGPAATAAPCPPPSVLAVAGTSLYPEGVAWDPTRDAFVVGSVRTGSVSVVRTDGTVGPLVADTGAVSTFGLVVDARRHRLLVTYADIGSGARSGPATERIQSGLLIVDLATGRIRHRVDLGGSPGPHAANDVTVDDTGTAWVTDTLGDAVYRVGTDGTVLGTVHDARFDSDSFGVNGIAWDPRGFVLTARYDTGELFRISADGRRVDPVAHEVSLVGADGLRRRPDGTVVVVTNSLGGENGTGVHELRADDGGAWSHAVEVAAVAGWPDPAPTAVTFAPGGAWVLSGRLDQLLSGEPVSASTFTIRLARPLHPGPATP
jgi:sugar lactone lactonase YvrE